MKNENKTGKNTHNDSFSMWSAETAVNDFAWKYSRKINLMLLHFFANSDYKYETIVFYSLQIFNHYNVISIESDEKF